MHLNSIIMKRGRVYVGKKSNRTVGAKNPVVNDVKNIDATSGSVNKINGECAKQFSPMFLGPVLHDDENHALIFENYWQYGKIFKQLGHVDKKGNITEKWLRFREKGYAKGKGDRHPVGTKSDEIKFSANGKNYYKYYTAISSFYNDEYYDYIESRKKIYAPIYADLVTETDAFIELKKLVDNGCNVQILDYDVLPGSNEVDVDLLIDRINDPSVPFGHGYVLAGLLLDITPDDYCI